MAIVESGAVPDVLYLGHSGVRNECWAGANGVVSGTFRSESAAPRVASQRSRRVPRQSTLLHRMRPSREAQARFAPEHCEFLTD
jgi:hypothetical protein